jgi:transposase
MQKKVVKKAVARKEIFYCRGISPGIKKFVIGQAKERGVAISVFLEHLLQREKKFIDERKKRLKKKHVS